MLKIGKRSYGLCTDLDDGNSFLDWYFYVYDAEKDCDILRFSLRYGFQKGEM